MIYMKINTHDYENDVRVMTGAFFPGEKIVKTDEIAEDGNLSIDTEIIDSNIHIKIQFNGQIYTSDKTSSGNDKKSIRNMLKRELYHILAEITGKELPWGTLTGIRPVKIPLSLIEEGCDDSFILDNLDSEYLISTKKAKLGLDVAHNEHKLLKTIDYNNGYSLYVGIPFCPTNCLYCSFTSYPLKAWEDKVDDYLDALLKELEFLSGFLEGKNPDSIYIGGGTPTTLLPYQLDRLLTFIEEHFPMENVREFTVEAGRPDSVDIDKFKVLKAHNIDRISINPQTMNQKTLDLIGRKHSVEQVKSAFYLARECGFDNINMDLIVGLPGENKSDVSYTLKEIAKLSPDNLTIHSLAIKRAARLNIFKEQYANYNIENTDDIMDMAHDFAMGLGMEPYYLYRQKNMAGNFENVGYAKPNKSGVYNILIMEEKQSIFAAGANAQTKVVYTNPRRVDRIENVKNVAEYIDRVDEMIERKRSFFNG